MIQVGIPTRAGIINNKKELIEFINKYNRINNLYKTVFNYKYLRTKDTPEYNSAIINQMFFDCDTENSLNAIKIFSEMLDKEDYMYYLVQSSFDKFPKLQIYVITEIEELQNKKNALLNSMIYLAKKSGLTYGDAHSCDLDKSTFGDLAQLCPIPGTFKPKRNCYCSYISKEDLDDIDKLKERAKLGNGKLVIYGDKRFSLKPFDYIDKTISCCDNIILEYDTSKIEVDNEVVNKFPPFIKKVLTNYKGYCDNYMNRWRVGLFLRDYGFLESQSEQILKEYYSKHLNWSTMNGTGTQWDRFCKCKSLYFIYHKEYKEFPSIQTLLDEGYEITKEDEESFNRLYGK